MSDFVVEVDRSHPLRNALVLTAFPTLGNVSAIAARFLVEVADLEPIGGIYSPRLPPMAAVQDGAPGLPVEVWAGERVCGLDGVCESLCVVTSHLVVPDEVAHDLAVAVLDWSREIGSGEVAVLEGVRQAAPGRGDGQLLGVGSNEAARERLRKADVPLLREGYVGGLSGVLLHRGAAWGLNVYGLLVRASEGVPDARAAAMLVKAADRILIHAGFDDAAIEGSVAKIEEQVRARQDDARQQVPMARDVAYL